MRLDRRNFIKASAAAAAVSMAGLSPDKVFADTMAFKDCYIKQST